MLYPESLKKIGSAILGAYANKQTWFFVSISFNVAVGIFFEDKGFMKKKESKNSRVQKLRKLRLTMWRWRA